MAQNDGLVPPKRPADHLRQRSLGLPESLWDRIDRLAVSKGYRTSEYLRALIETAVAKEEETATRKR